MSKKYTDKAAKDFIDCKFEEKLTADDFLERLKFEDKLRDKVMQIVDDLSPQSSKKQIINNIQQRLNQR